MVTREQDTPSGENPTLNLDLNLPVIGSTGVGGDSFETAAEKINEALRRLDNHDHTSGKGKGVPYSALCADADLNVNENNINKINLLNLIEILQPNITLNQTLYVLNKDLYFRDGFGNNIRITAGGNIVVGSTRQSFLAQPVSVTNVRYDNGILYVTYNNLESGSQVGDIIEYDIRDSARDVSVGEGAPGPAQADLPDNSFYVNSENLSLFFKLDGQWQDLTRRGEQGPQGVYRINAYRVLNTSDPDLGEDDTPTGGDRIDSPTDWTYTFPSSDVGDNTKKVYQSFSEYDPSNNTLTPWSAPFLATSLGIAGPAGEGVPRLGATGNILSKISGEDYDTGWIDPVDTNIQNIIPLYQRSSSSLMYADRPNGGVQDPSSLGITTVPTGWSLTTPSGDENLYISFALLKPGENTPFRYTTPWNIPVGTGTPTPTPTVSTFTRYAGIREANNSFSASDFTSNSTNSMITIPTWTGTDRYIAFAWPVQNDQGVNLDDPTELHIGGFGVNQLTGWTKQAGTITINSDTYNWWLLVQAAPPDQFSGVVLTIR